MEPSKLEVSEVAVLAEKLEMEVEKVEELKESFRALGDVIGEKTFGNGISPMSASGNYAGVPLHEANLSRNICGQMKWASDNTGLRYKPFFELDYEAPMLGVRIYKGDVLFDIINRPITGGLNGDPAKQIARDMYTLIGLCVEHAYNYSQANKIV